MKFRFLTLAILESLLFTLVTLTADENANDQNNVTHELLPENVMRSESARRAYILEKMKFYNVPGVSIAVVNDGKIAWANGYGCITSGQNCVSVDEHTLFQAASISKPITAFGALILVQQGKISLDEDVNKYLKRWKVPENEFTKSEKVTLRRLLSHTAGTSVDGFPGYTSQSKIPTIEDILKGQKPLVNTDPVVVIAKPGTEMKYSGGGTTIVQLLIEDVTGERFDVWMQNNVLEPLGMSESTFKQPLPPSFARHAAYGHHLGGVKVEGNWHIYPELGAAGLWSTPKDLARFIVYIQSALKNGQTKPLSKDYIKEMITRQKIGSGESDSGLGLFLEKQGRDLFFNHRGQNDGFIARLFGYAYGGKGLVIMMNNDAGWTLIEEIKIAVALSYDWPN